MKDFSAGIFVGVFVTFVLAILLFVGTVDTYTAREKKFLEAGVIQYDAKTGSLVPVPCK